MKLKLNFNEREYMQNLNKIIDVESFNREQGHGVTEKYKVIKTGDLIKSFQAEGYEITKTQVGRTRKVELQGYQKHLIRMRHPGLVLSQDGLTPEIVLKNSYDGTSAFNIMMGVFRIVCSNGLVVGTAYESLRVRHIGQDVLTKVFAALKNIQAQTDRIGDDIARFSSIQLNDSQAFDFARRIASHLVPDNTLTVGPVQGTLKFQDLLAVRRTDDQGQDLWTVLNRVQENALRGGLRYLSRNDKGQIRNQSVRRINSIDRNIEVNRLVWDVASEIADAA